MAGAGADAAYAESDSGYSSMPELAPSDDSGHGDTVTHAELNLARNLAIGTDVQQVVVTFAAIAPAASLACMLGEQCGFKRWWWWGRSRSGSCIKYICCILRAPFLCFAWRPPQRHLDKVIPQSAEMHMVRRVLWRIGW